MYKYNEEFVKSLVGKFVSCTNIDVSDDTPEFILVTGYEFVMLGDSDVPTALISYITCDMTKEKFQIFLEPNTSSIGVKIIA